MAAQVDCGKVFFSGISALSDLNASRAHAFSYHAVAPGRVNLIGEHTDYNDGFTLPLAIDRCTTVSARLTADVRGWSAYTSPQLGETVWWTADGGAWVPDPHGAATVMPLADASSAPHWSKYVAGVLQQFKRAGETLPPLELLIESDVPVGGGVSSSAALEVAVAMLVQRVLGQNLDGHEIARRCQAAEHEYAGVPCGLMDQLSSVFGRAGHLMLMDCRDQKLEFIPSSADVAYVVINSRIKHDLAEGEYRQRRQQCEAACRYLQVQSLRDVTVATLESQAAVMDSLLYRRARHVVTENERTLAAAAALREQRWERLGELMYTSHESMRWDYEITCPEIDALVAIAQGLGPGRGVWGARMTGGGFGGCVVVLVAAEAAAQICAEMVERYAAETGRTGDGFVTQPAAGALARFNA